MARLLPLRCGVTMASALYCVISPRAYSATVQELCLPQKITDAVAKISENLSPTSINGSPSDLQELVRASGLEPELRNIQARAHGLLTVQQFLKHRISSNEPAYLLGLTGGYRSTYQAIAEATGLTTWWKGFEEKKLNIGWENNGYFMDRAAHEGKQIYILVPDSLTTDWAQSYSYAELLHALGNSETMRHTTLVFGAHRLLGMNYKNGSPAREDNQTVGNQLKPLIEQYASGLNGVEVPEGYEQRLSGPGKYSPSTKLVRVPITEVPSQLKAYKGMMIENGELKQNIVQRAKDIYSPLLWSLNFPLAEGYVNAILAGRMSRGKYAAKFHDIWIIQNRHRIANIFSRRELDIFAMGTEEIKGVAAQFVREKAQTLSPVELKLIGYFRDFNMLKAKEKALEFEKVAVARAALARSNSKAIVAIYDLATGALHSSWLESYKRRHGDIPRFQPVPLNFIPDSVSSLPGIELIRGTLYQRVPE